MLHQTRTYARKAEKKFCESIKSFCFWSEVFMTIEKYNTHHYTENSNSTNQCLVH
ncbi:hypothetical protein NC653_010014 [Populus alba x Populus x berolinensis]|uniref:Uncharacterized protein n=1 Tax=Populus alba x Populus x berolinensis TaxID=444605 RepID=A0AAD6R842_9ROSI|nr:hypothetical protein NC653_009103 [Populus alba x Populus x berolinensis]KAJ7005382.1 hypothetical protein NC653_010014 [Populus alba x Populus x berolinensis]